MRKILTAVALSLLTSVGCAQVESIPLKAGVMENGITYFLPKTVLHVAVTSEKTTFYPGEFADYASLLLRVDDVVTKKYSQWTLKDVEVEPYGVADSSKVYLMKYKSKYGTPEVSFSSSGVLLAANAEAEEIEPLAAPSHEIVASDKLGGAYRSSAMHQVNSRYKLAQMAADELFELRESRTSLIKGEADFMPKDGEQLKLMIDQLAKQEKKLLSLFYGSQQKEVFVQTFDYVIPQRNIEKVVLCRFSSYDGLVESSNLSGNPVYINMANVQKEFSRTNLEVDKDKKSIFYIVPAIMNTKVYNAEQCFYNENIPVAQQGHVEYLNAELFGKKVLTEVVFSPTCGSILRIKSRER